MQLLKMALPHTVSADDIALLSVSCFGLQKLIHVCEEYGAQWDIKFNPVKSQVTSF